MPHNSVANIFTGNQTVSFFHFSGSQLPNEMDKFEMKW